MSFWQVPCTVHFKNGDRQPALIAGIGESIEQLDYSSAFQESPQGSSTLLVLLSTDKDEVFIVNVKSILMVEIRKEEAVPL